MFILSLYLNRHMKPKKDNDAKKAKKKNAS